MSAWEKIGEHLVLVDERGRFTVGRHGEGRKYWGVTFPDGTYTHSALTQSAAKEQAEAWRPDPTMAALVDDVAADADRVPAAAVPSAKRDLIELVDSVVRDATARDLEPVRRGWGYQDAGDAQQRALVAIRDLTAMRDAVENALRAQVAVARNNTGRSWYSNAATWEAVGEALGVKKQSAQRKYGGTG